MNTGAIMDRHTHSLLQTWASSVSMEIEYETVRAGVSLAGFDYSPVLLSFLFDLN